MRPTCLRFGWPAIPTTSVANSSGAMIVLIIRMKIWLRSRIPTPTAGKSWPISAPISIDTRIHAVSERRRQAHATAPAMNVQRPNRPTSGARPAAHAAEARSAPPRTIAAAGRAPCPRRGGAVGSLTG